VASDRRHDRRGRRTKDPCKVVTTAEIAKAFDGATVARGRRAEDGGERAVQVRRGATASLPAGDLVVHVMFIGGKPAHDGLKDTPPTSRRPASRSRSTTSVRVVNTLKGSILLGMQGLFTDGSCPSRTRT
jgi:hypothetical protein